jgi:hypothetical protein
MEALVHATNCVCPASAKMEREAQAGYEVNTLGRAEDLIV